MVFQNPANGPSAQFVTEVRHRPWIRVKLGPVLGGHAHHLLQPISVSLPTSIVPIKQRQRMGGMLNYYYREAA